MYRLAVYPLENHVSDLPAGAFHNRNAQCLEVVRVAYEPSILLVNEDAVAFLLLSDTRAARGVLNCGRGAPSVCFVGGRRCCA